MEAISRADLGNPHRMLAEKVADLKPEVATFAVKKFKNQAFRGHKRLNFSGFKRPIPMVSLEFLMESAPRTHMNR